MGQTLTIIRCDACTAENGVIDSDPRSAGRLDHFRTVSHEHYERSVRATREASYDPLLNRVKRLTGSRGRWLDVGCSFGWLLARLRCHGIEGFGVEPSLSAVESARQFGLRVTQGIFPDVVGEGAPYNVISFMDVLEHLPDPAMVLGEARKILVPGGLVVVQVPDQACLLYWTAGALCRWTQGRVDFALRRLWLVGLDFPHLVYFTRTSLTTLLVQCGYEIAGVYRAPISHPRQSYDRVSALSGTGWFSGVVSGAVGGITALDALTGHGGLLVALAVAPPSSQQK